MANLCRSLTRAVPTVAAILMVGGCITTEPPPQPPLTPTQLLAGPVPMATDQGHQPVSPQSVLKLDNPMRQFVMTHIPAGLPPLGTLKSIVHAMRSRGLLSLSYSTFETGTVEETFHLQKGNCLSFTMLFIALAREAGLNAVFEIVDVPPKWTMESGTIVRETHVNALIYLPSGTSDIIVDFNDENTGTSFPREVVSDSYAIALFYNNRGAAAFLDQRYYESFLNYREAIKINDTVASTWTNLGVLYAHLGWLPGAEGAYLQSLTIDPDDSSALNNLAGLYAKSGNTQLAEQYRERIEQTRNANPYYHFYLAKTALETGDDTTALKQIRKAISLKADAFEFQELRGQIENQLGNVEGAARSFALAARYSRPNETEITLPHH